MKFKDYINEAKPKKGDYVQSVTGRSTDMIDKVSGGSVYTAGKPVQRDQYFIKYLKLAGTHKGKNLWKDT